jgi:hypothetical protein
LSMIPKSGNRFSDQIMLSMNFTGCADTACRNWIAKVFAKTSTGRQCPYGMLCP